VRSPILAPHPHCFVFLRSETPSSHCRHRKDPDDRFWLFGGFFSSFSAHFFQGMLSTVPLTQVDVLSSRFTEQMAPPFSQSLIRCRTSTDVEIFELFSSSSKNKRRATSGFSGFLPTIHRARIFAVDPSSSRIGAVPFAPPDMAPRNLIDFLTDLLSRGQRRSFARQAQFPFPYGRGSMSIPPLPNPRMN